MKTIFNKIKAISLGSSGVFVVTLLIMSSPVLAVTADRSERTTVESKNSANVCSRLMNLETATLAKLSERDAAMKANFEKRQSNISNRHSEIDQKVATYRISLSDKFDAKVTELKAKEGITDSKLAAIDTYVEAMKTAEAERQAVVDAARLTYRTAMKQEVANHQQRLAEAAATFQASVKAAFAVAKANCNNTDAIPTLKTAIKTARDVFASSRKAEATGASIKQLAVTRTDSIKAAHADFKNKAESYRATLKAAL